MNERIVIAVRQASKAQGIWLIQENGQGTMNPAVLRELLKDYDRLRRIEEAAHEHEVEMLNAGMNGYDGVKLPAFQRLRTLMSDSAKEQG